ncbi:MAG: hypothetical protein WKF58_09590 [Ilumatobacteraceae bacterium]
MLLELDEHEAARTLAAVRFEFADLTDGELLGAALLLAQLDEMTS